MRITDQSKGAHDRAVIINSLLLSLLALSHEHRHIRRVFRKSGA